MFLDIFVYQQKPEASAANCAKQNQKLLRAGDRVRTGDIQLGRLTLYQLSYSRNFMKSQKRNSIFQNFNDHFNLNYPISFGFWSFKIEISAFAETLWGEQDSNLRRRSQQIYSLPSLAA
jgi:hypothetical protein